MWSNRLGALPIFAGAEPEPDERGWSLFAAAGWFIADATPIRGTTRWRRGRRSGCAPAPGAPARTSTTTVTRAAGELAGRHEAYFRGAVDEAANQAIGLARDLAELFDEPPTVDLSGGRDSRDLARPPPSPPGSTAASPPATRSPASSRSPSSWSTAPHPLEHLVTRPETDPDDDLRRRVAPSTWSTTGCETRRRSAGRWSCRPVEPTRPTLSGDGGEIARGFYYPSPGCSPRSKRAARRASPSGSSRRVAEHAAAHRDAYRAYRAEVERALDEGRRHGLAGAGLLDYFYLVHRLAYRSGLGARGGRYSACLTPAFVRAAFDLTPEQRLEGKLHHDLIARLAPAGSEAPLVEPADPDPDPDVPECGLWGVLRDVHRARIWERPGDAEAVEEMIADGKAWPELFRRRPVRKAWKEARAGKGHQHWEAVFNRIAWREGFEEHLRELARAATAELSARPQPHGGA